MNIGSVKTDNNIFLAPMAGITDLPFRIICKEQGCGLVYTEMVSAKGIVYRDPKTRLLAFVDPRERPAAVQIFGSDTGVIGEAAAILAEAGSFDMIDINMGCPTPKIVKNGDGSALMRDTRLAERVTRAAADAAGRQGMPVTVKIRKGWDAESPNAVETALAAEAGGAAAVAVHGRTRDQFYSGKADLGAIADVKKALKVPVIGNGDIYTAADAARMFAETGCDAVMIARGAQGNPWIFREILDPVGLAGLTREDKLDAVRRHFDMLIECKGAHSATLEMRKHAAWYTRGAKNSAALRSRIFTAESPAEMRAMISELFPEQP